MAAALLSAPALSVAGPSSRAEVLLREGRLQAALDEANRDARERPADVAAQELVLDIVLSMGNFGFAESQAKARVQSQPTSADAHYLLGRALTDPLESRRAYESALRLKPDHARAHMGMGSIHEAAAKGGVARQRLSDAEAAYGRAVRYDPSLGEAWHGRVRSLMRMGREAEAKEAAAAGLAAVPDEPGLALLAAQLEPERAMSILEAALATTGPDPQLYASLARHELRAGQAVAARRHAEAALAAQPTLADARRTRALARELEARRLTVATLGGLQSLERASATATTLEGYAKLVKQAPRSAMVRFDRAAARRLAGDQAGELQDLEAAFGLDRGNDEVSGVYGTTLLERGRHADAVEPLTAALSARPSDPNLGLALARALSGAGHPHDARLLLERVASAHPRHIDLQLTYVQALVDAGDTSRAYAAARVALQVNQDPRLVAAFVKVAPLAGRAGEAADVLAPLAEQSAELRAVVTRLRAIAGG